MTLTACALLLTLTACASGTTGTSTSTGAVGESSTTTTRPTTAVSTSPTTPAPTTGQVLVLGDWGSGTSAQSEVAGAMSRYAEDNDIEAILTTGDNFYADDAQRLMDPFTWAVQDQIPFWVTWGNHDVETEARIDAVDDTFGTPPRWTVHEWGVIYVIILDSTQVDVDDQRAFLVDTLGRSDDPTIVVFHHPAVSCGSYHDNEQIGKGWVANFDDDVFLVLSGHDHNYQRFVEDEVTYVVSGGGGQRLYGIDQCPAGHPTRLAGETVHHFLVLDQTSGVTLTAIDMDGNVIDEFEVLEH